MTIRKPSKALLMVLAVSAVTSLSFAQNNQASGDLSNARLRFITVAPHGHSNIKNGAGIPGIDSLINFNGHYTTPGVGPTGKKTNFWYYNMVGKLPQNGGTTYVNAPVVPVSLDLLDSNGNVALHYSVKPFIVPTLYSP